MARGKPSEPPASTTGPSSSSGLTVSVSLGSTEENPRKYGWITRCLLAIPEPWLTRWGMKINAACCAFVLLWAGVSMTLSLGGVFRHWGLTPAQGLLVEVAWVPVLMVSQFLFSARTAHALAWLDDQQDRMAAFDQDMADQIAKAAFVGVRAAMEGGEEPTGPKGPTIQ